MRALNAYTTPEVFAVKHKSNSVRMASRSGGTFTALTDYIFSQKGIVYGCVLDKQFLPYHIRATSQEGRNRMRGTKYVQSTIGDTYKQVKADLGNQKTVLFSGTSCQIAGLLGYLAKSEKELLFCVDIVCHGVPSRKVWSDYIAWQEKKMGRKCSSVDFRNKVKYGWSAHVETLSFDSFDYDSRVFAKLFYHHHILRPACYQCPYKDIVHPGDITLADYWGIDTVFPEFNDKKGVSLVLINNEKGKFLFTKIKGDVAYQKSNIEKSMQPPLIAPFPQPKNRDKFWRDYLCYDFSVIARKYTHRSLMRRVRGKSLSLMKEITEVFFTR
jgi:coenzyme F420-reducing hydrogenase beta subunit